MSENSFVPLPGSERTPLTGAEETVQQLDDSERIEVTLITRRRVARSVPPTPRRHAPCVLPSPASMSDAVAPLETEAREFYCHTVGVLDAAGLPFLIGGAYAFSRYTGIERHTKDFDIFVKPDDF